MPSLSLDQLTSVALGSAVLAVAALAFAGGALLRLGRLRRDYRLLRGQAGEGDVLELAARHAAEVRLLREGIERQAAELARARADVAATLRRVAVVRYDAFDDIGGRMSFSAAMVDDAGDGLVLSAIHGRSESRSYAKGLSGGTSDLALSPEEKQAVAAARAERPGAERPGKVRR